MNVESGSRNDPPAESTPHVSVVIMAWNEATTLAAVAREIHEELVRSARSFEILVIDDGSTDGTGPLADELAHALPGLRVHHHDTNRGLGAVYRTAFALVRGELVTFFPADGQFAASIIGEYLAAMTDTDIILGVLPDRGGPLSGRLLSLGERVLLRVLFGWFPRFQGILMFRRALLEGTSLHSQGRGWTVLMELILRKARSGARIKNLPIAIRPRQSGQSKVNNLRSIFSNLRQVLALRLHL